MSQILIVPRWFMFGVCLLAFPMSSHSSLSQSSSQSFQSFSQLSDYLLKTKKWPAKDLVVEVIETQKKLAPSSLHDIAVTNKSLCGSGGCPYIIIARMLSPKGLVLTTISSEFFGEFQILPTQSHGRYDISVLAHMGSDNRAKQTLKFNGRIYD